MVSVPGAVGGTALGETERISGWRGKVGKDGRRGARSARAASEKAKSENSRVR